MNAKPSATPPLTPSLSQASLTGSQSGCCPRQKHRKYQVRVADDARTAVAIVTPQHWIRYTGITYMYMSINTLFLLAITKYAHIEKIYDRYMKRCILKVIDLHVHIRT